MQSFLEETISHRCSTSFWPGAILVWELDSCSFGQQRGSQRKVLYPVFGFHCSSKFDLAWHGILYTCIQYKEETFYIYCSFILSSGTNWEGDQVLEMMKMQNAKFRYPTPVQNFLLIKRISSSLALYFNSVLI